MQEAQFCVTNDALTLAERDPILSPEERDRRRETYDMVANVQRQGEFVDKMHRHLWLRSPALEGTLRRAVDRYDKFVQLFKQYPGRVLVPTLDIDIVWHTHQCSASLYEEAMEKIAGRFINHDDKYGQASLDVNMEKTESYFQARFGGQYSRCLCWECEATLSALEDADKAGTLSGTDDAELGEKLFRRLKYYREAEIGRRQGGTLLPRADLEPF
jgi:hypothetical protein